MGIDEVRKIAVLRPNAVGDFVFFLPALPGVGAPVDAACDAHAIGRFDIALQMFGAGHYSNSFLLRLGARADGAPLLDRWVPYCEPNNRRLALLEIAALAGTEALLPSPVLPPLPELEVTEADRSEAAAIMPPMMSGEDAPLVLLQPGATDPRRCWPAERFAALGDRLAQAGMRVAVNGGAGKAVLVAAVMGTMRQPAIGLAGKLSLGGLCGLLERAALVVSNDTGPLHLALALGRPSVGIFWLTNLIEGMPLRQSHLRAALSLRTRCPVCGRDNIATRCPHDESFVADVILEQVAQLVLSLLHQ